MRTCNVCGHQNPADAASCLRCGVTLRQTAILRASSLPDARSPTPSVFIGRLSELARLQSALMDVHERGQSRVVVVSGTAGIGKSRLLSEFGAALSQTGGRLFRGASLTHGRPTSRWAVGELVRDILSISDMDPSRAQFDSLLAFLQKLRIEDTAPFLAHALGIAQADPSVSERLRPLEAPVLQMQMHIALRRLLLAVSDAVPTAFVIDELNPLDRTSHETLAALLAMTVEDPLYLVLATSDEEPVQRMLAQARRQTGRVSEIRLPPLTKAESDVLLDSLVREPGDSGLALKAQIAAQAEGNALYMQEAMRMLSDRVPLVSGAVASRLPQHAPMLLAGIDSDPRALVERRIQLLRPALRQTLQWAAVLGPVFPVALLQLLDGDPGFGGRWGELTARQIWVLEPSGESCMFLHTLMAETLFGSIPAAERARMHDHVARFIEQSAAWPANERTELLAFHYYSGTQPNQATTYLLAAAAIAERRLANETAVDFYSRGVGLLRESPNADSSQRERAQLGFGRSLVRIGRGEDGRRILHKLLEDIRHRGEMTSEWRATEIEVLYELAGADRGEGHWDEAGGWLVEALNLYTTGGGKRHTPEWYRMLEQIATVRLAQHRLDDAADVARMATTEPPTQNAENVLVRARLYGILGDVYMRRAKYREAGATLQASLDLYRSHNYGPGMAAAHAALGRLQLNDGNWHAAEEDLRRAYSLHGQCGESLLQVADLDDLGHLHMVQGNFDAARHDFEGSLSLLRQPSDGADAARLHGRLAQVALLQSIDTEAVRQLQLAGDAAGGTTPVELRAYLLGVESQLLANSGELAEGLQKAEQSLALAREAGSVEQETDGLRVLGALHSRARHGEPAEQFLRDALARSRQAGDRYRTGQALYELGRLYQGMDRKPEAQELFMEAQQIFYALGAAYDLRRLNRRVERKG